MKIFSFMLIVVTVILFGCAMGGKGGRDGGDATVDVGPIDTTVKTCVGTTVECENKK